MERQNVVYAGFTRCFMWRPREAGVDTGQAQEIVSFRTGIVMLTVTVIDGIGRHDAQKLTVTKVSGSSRMKLVWEWPHGLLLMHTHSTVNHKISATLHVSMDIVATIKINPFKIFEVIWCIMCIIYAKDILERGQSTSFLHQRDVHVSVKRNRTLRTIAFDGWLRRIRLRWN